jgi:type II secretory pathway pseudopilin PulG
MKKILATMMLGIALSAAMPSVVMAETPSEKIKREQAELEVQRAEKAKAREAERDSLELVFQQQQAEYDAQNARTHRYIWLICGVFIIVFVGSWAYRNKGTFLSIVRFFTGGFRTKGDITTLESKKILTGALYAEQQGAFLNTLKADIGSKLYTILGEWWSINGRDSAVETLDYLRDKGFAYYFPTVCKASQAGSDEAIKAIIIENMTTQEDAEKAYSQTCNLKESINQLKELKIINHADDIEKLGVEGWDAGRLIFIARLCCDAKYITEDEAWEYIDAAYALAQSKFNSWAEIAKSYIIGRFLWNGSDANDGMAALAEDLINKPGSPWQQVAWK